MNSSKDILIRYFNKILPLNETEKERVLNVFTEKKVRRRQFILQEGDICKHHTFVVEGCFKMYRIDSQGKEHNLQFASENEWITDIGSLHKLHPSSLFIEAIEPSIILQIERTDLWELHNQFHNFDRIFRVIIEDKFIELQNRMLLTISSIGQERYQFFLKQYPHLINRLPNTQIASYLGITPEFLSKIRRTHSKK